jgi:putative copper export protein
VPEGTALAVGIDWLHISAMVAWLGGLVPLSIALRAAQRNPDGALPLAALIKLGLFSVLLLLGGLNLFILSQRLRTSGNRLAGAFGRSVRGELVGGALLLLAVGMMTSVAPSNTAWAL